MAFLFPDRVSLHAHEPLEMSGANNNHLHQLTKATIYPFSAGALLLMRLCSLLHSFLYTKKVFFNRLLQFHTKKRYPAPDRFELELLVSRSIN